MILDRMLVREVIKAVIAVSLLLLLIIVAHRFVRYLAEAAVGGLSADVIVLLLALVLAKYLVILLPPSLFLGIQLTLGRMYRDSEMVVLGACGVGSTRLHRAILWVAVPFALLVAGMSFFVGPWAERQLLAIQAQQEHSLDIGGVLAGRFHEFRGGRVVLFVESTDKETGRLEQVFIQDLERGKIGVLVARSARNYVHPDSGERYLVLEDGYRYEGKPGRADYRVSRFEEFAVGLSDPRQGTARQRKSAIPSVTLWGATGLAEQAELQWRLSLPISAFLLSLLALPLSESAPRQGRYGKILVAVLAYVCYSNLLGVAQAWMEQGHVPAWLGLWWVHGVIIIVLLVLLRRGRGRRARVSLAPQRRADA
jgi:lipopolysaccharide export system permease protein